MAFPKRDKIVLIIRNIEQQAWSISDSAVSYWNRKVFKNSQNINNFYVIFAAKPPKSEYIIFSSNEIVLLTNK